jgi:hypothetical protein
MILARYFHAFGVSFTRQDLIPLYRRQQLSARLISQAKLSGK